MPVYIHVQEQTQSSGAHSTTSVTRSALWEGTHMGKQAAGTVTAAQSYLDLCMRPTVPIIS